MKLIDHGEEVLVDISELLQLEKQCSTIPAFAQPFRLYNYDETVSVTQLMEKEKNNEYICSSKMLLLQHVI